MTPAEVFTTRLLYQRQQYVVMPGYITDQFVADYRKWFEDSILSLSILGDESDHSWSEIPEPTLSSIKYIVDTEVLEAILERPIQSWAQWINVYSSAQFIAGHRDAGGDAHLLICIEVPNFSDGGQLWLSSEDNVIPVGSGDAVLFDARGVFHGTTAVEAETSSRQ